MNTIILSGMVWYATGTDPGGEPVKLSAFSYEELIVKMTKFIDDKPCNLQNGDLYYWEAAVTQATGKTFPP